MKRAYKAARHGQRRASSRFGYSEIKKLHLPDRRDFDVVGLDVSVHYSPAVNIVDRFNYRLKTTKGIEWWKAAPRPDAISQRLSFYVLHYDARLTVVFEKVVKRGDVVVLETALYAGFIQKPLEELGARGSLTQNLYRYNPAYL